MRQVVLFLETRRMAVHAFFCSVFLIYFLWVQWRAGEMTPGYLLALLLIAAMSIFIAYSVYYALRRGVDQRQVAAAAGWLLAGTVLIGGAGYLIFHGAPNFLSEDVVNENYEGDLLPAYLFFYTRWYLGFAEFGLIFYLLHRLMVAFKSVAAAKLALAKNKDKSQNKALKGWPRVLLTQSLGSDRIVPTDTAQICAVLVEGNVSTIYLATDAVIRVGSPLSELKAVLPPSVFVQINRNTLISLNHFLSRSGDTISIQCGPGPLKLGSRQSYPDFYDWYDENYGGKRLK